MAKAKSAKSFAFNFEGIAIYIGYPRKDGTGLQSTQLKSSSSDLKLKFLHLKRLLLLRLLELSLL